MNQHQIKTIAEIAIGLIYKIVGPDEREKRRVLRHQFPRGVLPRNSKPQGYQDWNDDGLIQRYPH